MVVLEVSLKKLIFSHKKKSQERVAEKNPRAQQTQSDFLKKSKNSNVCISWMCADRINGSVKVWVNEVRKICLRIARVYFAWGASTASQFFSRWSPRCAKKSYANFFSTCEIVVAFKMRAVVILFFFLGSTDLKLFRNRTYPTKKIINANKTWISRWFVKRRKLDLLILNFCIRSSLIE